MRPELLHVVTPVFNPVRFSSRYRLFERFAAHMFASGVQFHPVEIQIGDRDFVCTPQVEEDWPIGRWNRLDLRTRNEMWFKENMINLAVARLPNDWEYVAWIDGDIQFRRADWAGEAVHLLQHYDVIQLFSHAELHGPNDFDHADIQRGFVFQYHKMLKERASGEPWRPPHGKYPYGGWWGHSGYGWAMRREAFNAVGGLMDTCILGSADHHMACAMVGAVGSSVPRDVSPAYLRMLSNWQVGAEIGIRRNIGFLPGTIDHWWHGPSKNRKYVERWKILTNNQFDPDSDLRRDWQGLYQLAGNKPRLRDEIRFYFRQRNEDSNDASLDQL